MPRRGRAMTAAIAKLNRSIVAGEAPADVWACLRGIQRVTAPTPIEVGNNNAEYDTEMVTCDECREDVRWTDATHRPFGIYCGRAQCEINGRRAHDGLPIEVAQERFA